jgi:hypothetical protein
MGQRTGSRCLPPVRSSHIRPRAVSVRRPEGLLLPHRLALACVSAGVITTGLGTARLGGALLLIGAVLGLHIFARPEQPPKTQAIHGSFAVFVRIAYV